MTSASVGTVHARVYQNIDRRFRSRTRDRQTLPVALTIIDHRCRLSLRSLKFVDELQKPFHFRVDRGYVFGDNALDEIPNLLKRIAQTPHFFMYAFGSLTMNFHLSCPFDMRRQRNISVHFSLSRAAREPGQKQFDDN